jgi:hypothetical protein
VNLYLPATAVSLYCLMPLSANATPPATAPHPPAVPSRSPTPLPTTAMTSESFAAAAAARHAKRTACLKEAKSKKLVGTSKNDYVKECLGGT